MATNRRIVAHTATGERDLLVTLGAQTTVAMLGAALGLPDGPLLVDDRLVPADATVIEAGLLDGSAVATAPVDHDQPQVEPVVSLEQIAGLTAGGSLALAPGDYAFGENSAITDGLGLGAPDALSFGLRVDQRGQVIAVPGNSRARIGDQPLVAEAPLGSSILDVGTARFRCADPTPAARRRPSPHPIRRRSRQTDPEPETMVTAPAVPDTPSSRPRWHLQHRRDNRRHQAEVAEIAQRFGSQLANVRERYETYLRDQHPSPAVLQRWALLLDQRLWERRPQHEDFGRVAIAVGDLAWRPKLAAGGDLAPELAEVYARIDRLRSVPLVADLCAGPIGIAGPRASTRACGRAVVLRSSAYGGPDDVRIGLLASADEVAAWDWLKWLPHAGYPARVATSLADGDELASELCTDELRSVAQPFVIAGDVELLQHPSSAIGRGFAQRRLTGVVMAETVDDLPTGCSAMLEIRDDGSACFVDVSSGRTQPYVTPIGTSTAVATLTAQTMACMVDVDVLDSPGDAVAGEVAVRPFELHAERRR